MTKVTSLNGCRAGRHGPGWEVGDATRITHAFGSFIHGTKKEVLTAGGYAVAGTFGFDKAPGKVRKGSQGAAPGHSSQTPGESWSPAGEVLAEKSLLRVATDQQFLWVELVLQGICLLGG